MYSPSNENCTSFPVWIPYTPFLPVVLLDRALLNPIDFFLAVILLLLYMLWINTKKGGYVLCQPLSHFKSGKWFIVPYSLIQNPPTQTLNLTLPTWRKFVREPFKQITLNTRLSGKAKLHITVHKKNNDITRAILGIPVLTIFYMCPPLQRRSLININDTFHSIYPY